MAFDLRRLWTRGDAPTTTALGRLPHGWHVVARPSGDGVDHVVLGPPGVFNVGVRDLHGTIWVGKRSVLLNRRRTDLLDAVKSSTAQASASLSAVLHRTIEVHGALAILADAWTIKDQPVDVFVGSPRIVRDWLLRLPPRMTPREVAEVRLAANDPTTWMVSTTG